MNFILKLSGGAALVSFLLKLVLFKMNFSYETTVYVNLLLILLVVFFAMRQAKNDESTQTTFLFDVKAGMRGASLYALFIALLAMAYYHWFNPDFLQSKIDERIVLLENTDFDTLKSEGKIPKDADPEKLKSEQIEMMQTIFSPFVYGTLSLFGYLILGAFYSLLMATMLKYAPGFQRPKSI